MPLFSNSRLDAFEQCPLKYKFCYIDELETEFEDTVEAFMGSRVHEALEKLYKDAKFQKILSKKEIIDLYNQEWRKNWSDKIVIVRDDYGEENYRMMGEKYLIDYYNRYSPFDQSKTIGLETENTVEIAPNYQIHVRIDRLSVKDDVYEIHDYKTGNRLPTQEQLDDDRQLAIYCYGVKKMYPDAKEVKLVWHFLAFDKEMGSHRTDEQLETLRKEIMGLIKDIESCKEFDAKESALCDWCEYQPQCPRFMHLFKTEALETSEYLSDNGVSLVNRYATVSEEKKKMEMELEALKEAIVEFCKGEGIEVVYGSDVKARLSSYPKLIFPKKYDDNRQEFIETVRKLGLFEELSTVDTYELAKMINSKELPGEFIKILDKFIKRDETTTIRLSRK